MSHYMRFLFICFLSTMTSFSFKSNFNQLSERLQLQLNSNSNTRLDAVTTDKTNSIISTTSSLRSPSSSSSSQSQSIKNLKKSPGNLPDDDFLNSWKELKADGLLPLSKVLTEKNSIRYNKALNLAYRRCEYLTQLFSKTFYMGTSLMPPQSRKHVWAIYAWCRRTDDLVDSPRACLLNRENLNNDLVEWNNRLENIFHNRPHDLFDFAMVDTVQQYPDLSIEPFRDMIKGMVMDVPGLGQERYQNFDELYLYCYRVAATVGLMTLPMLGTAPGVTVAEATEPAVALGIGLQLTNILRDVGEDLERGRIYLPLDELAQFGLSEEDLFKCKVTDKYKNFMKFQIQRARDYYAIAQKGIDTLSYDGRFAVQVSLDLYSRILDVIERNDYDNFNKRAYTTKLEKLSILPKSWLTVQQMKK